MARTFADLTAEEILAISQLFPLDSGKYLTNDGTNVSWGTLDGKQDVCEEKTTDFTAAVHGNYIITGTATVTDPTPEAGHGFSCLVRNGTATVGGTAYAIVGTRIERTYHSGAWANAVWLPIAAPGTAAQVLTSNGSASAPTFQDAAGGGGGRLFDRVEVKGPLLSGFVTYQVAHDAGSIAGVKITVTDLPTGSSVKVDIRKNGTATTDSIFTSDTEAEITTGTSATNGVYTVTKTAIDNGTFAADDVCRFYVTLIGSTLPGTNLSIVTY